MRTKKTSIWLKQTAALILFTFWTGSTASAQVVRPSPNGVRQSDSLLNGALIGAGAGVASGLVLCTMMEPWRNCRDDYGSMLKIGAIGAGIGMGIDALIRKKVYQTASGSAEVHEAPIIGRRAQGLRLSVQF